MPATTKTAAIHGMVCAACETRINKRLAHEPGVITAKADYTKNTLHITFDPEELPWKRLTELLDTMGYTLSPEDTTPNSGSGTGKTLRQIAGTLLVTVALYWIGVRLGLLTLLNLFPEAESGMGLGMIFVIGLLTSAHCLAMCGGINLSQTLAATQPENTGTQTATTTPVLLYGAGRVLSYTAIGAAVGGLGSVLSLSAGSKGFIQIAAGLFMMLMGLNLMGIFPWLRRLVPRLPQSLAGKTAGGIKRGPLYVGLLNGLMPCGPLQTMQLFALSTGSPVDGALSMLAFALGTLPLTMGLGMLASYLGRRFLENAVRAGAALVFLMGLAMLGNGLTLSGFVRPELSGDGEIVESVVAPGTEMQTQTLSTELRPDSYQAVRLRTGLPVVWRITAEERNINGCNNRFFIPEYNIEHRLLPGENIIKFTPEEPGVYPYMCWMGMIASRIVVGDVEDTGAAPEFDASVLPDPESEEDIPWLD